MVPNQLEGEEQDGLLGAMAGSSALLFLLPLFEFGLFGDLALSALVGGGLSGYAALRKDGVGDVARQSGKIANKGALVSYGKAKEVNEEYQLTEKAKDSAIAAAKELTQKIKDKLRE